MHKKDNVVTRWHLIKIRDEVVKEFGRGQIGLAGAFLLIRTWIDKNIAGRWSSFAHLFYFENEYDAFMFKLRWGE
jgi:hypothetical protein